MTGRGARLLIDGLTKTYGVHTALAPTHLAIEAGEFFSLIGPSGSGKSTLLGCMAGFLAPSAGRLEIDGEDVVAIPPYRRNIGMVFQNYALFPHMTVFENIAFPLRLRGVGDAEIKSRVERMLDTVRLGTLGARSPAQLSGGQQQRVALARAAVYDPRLLLMDEPLGALDKNLREELQYEIRQFHATLGVTIVYVTHDQDEAATMSDRIGIMRDGAIVQTGKPRYLYESPVSTFVAGFLGEANLFEVRALRPNGACMLAVTTSEGLELTSSAPAPEAAGPLTACIRPEALTIRPTEARAGAGGGPAIHAQVTDVIYTAGTIRYRVTTPAGALLTVKRPLERTGSQIETGHAVTLSYRPADILLISRE